MVAPTTRRQRRRLYAHRPDRKLEDLGARVAAFEKALGRLISTALDTRRERLAHLARTLHAISPLETMGRGYAIVTAARSGEVISHVGQVQPGDAVSARLADGALDCTVDAVREKN